MARIKPEKIPAGDEYLPDVPEAELESVITVIPARKKIPRILTAVLKRKRHGSISSITSLAERLCTFFVLKRKRHGSISSIQRIYSY